MGLVEYRARNYTSARKHFERLVASGNRDQDVAIALHLLGHMAAGKPRLWRKAEQLYRDSLELGANIPHHVAQVKHSLANLLAKRRDRDAKKEAEQLYRDSLEILEDGHDAHGVAQVSFNLAKLLRARNDEHSLNEALGLAKAAYEINSTLGPWRFASVSERLVREIEQQIDQSS